MPPHHTQTYNTALSCLKPQDVLRKSNFTAGVYYEQGLLNEAIQTYQEAIAREANFPEAYNNLGNALREANRMEEAMQCYTMCIQLQLRTPRSGQAGGGANISPPAAAFQQAQRLSVAYNNLGGIFKMQVTNLSLTALSCSHPVLEVWQYQACLLTDPQLNFFKETCNALWCWMKAFAW